MLDSVIAAFHQGHSAETIAQQYPALTLEEIYGTITDYLANKAEMDQYLQRQDEVWRRERDKADHARPVSLAAGPVGTRGATGEARRHPA